PAPPNSPGPSTVITRYKSPGCRTSPRSRLRSAQSTSGGNGGFHAAGGDTLTVKPCCGRYLTGSARERHSCFSAVPKGKCFPTCHNHVEPIFTLTLFVTSILA